METDVSLLRRFSVLSSRGCATDNDHGGDSNDNYIQQTTLSGATTHDSTQASAGSTNDIIHMQMSCTQPPLSGCLTLTEAELKLGLRWGRFCKQRERERKEEEKKLA